MLIRYLQGACIEHNLCSREAELNGTVFSAENAYATNELLNTRVNSQMLSFITRCPRVDPENREQYQAQVDTPIQGFGRLASGRTLAPPSCIYLPR